MGNGLHLQFGGGKNVLPQPWQNLNASHDIRKHLRFENGSASAIFAEHVIEHVPFLQGVGFLRECHRVLAPGGLLRVSFPDVTRFAFTHANVDPQDGTVSEDDVHFTLTGESDEYGELMHARPGVEFLVDNALPKTNAALLLTMTGWGHQCLWTANTAAVVLLTLGFRCVDRRPYQKGRLSGIDGHHLDVGAAIAALETTVVEALK